MSFFGRRNNSSKNVKGEGSYAEVGWQTIYTSRLQTQRRAFPVPKSNMLSPQRLVSWRDSGKVISETDMEVLTMVTISAGSHDGSEGNRQRMEGEKKKNLADVTVGCCWEKSWCLKELNPWLTKFGWNVEWDSTWIHPLPKITCHLSSTAVASPEPSRRVGLCIGEVTHLFSFLAWGNFVSLKWGSLENYLEGREGMKVDICDH